MSSSTPGGPARGDRYAVFIQPALAGIEALDRYDAAITAAEALLAKLTAAFAMLDTALTAAEGEGGEVLDAGRVERLLYIRRQLDAARLEHAGLIGDLEDARPLKRSFLAKAERMREAAISILFEQLVSDRRVALDRLRQHVVAIHGSADEETAPVRDLVAAWEARLGQPVRLPTIKWPKGADPFSPPTLVEPEA
jgi:hypothetical protein